MNHIGMKFSLFTDYGSLNSKPVFDAFANGARLLGHDIVFNDYDCDVPVIWSVLWNGRMSKNRTVWQFFRQQGRPVVVLEVGGLKRNSTWKVGINGINRDAYFGSGGNSSSRFEGLGLELKPWKTDNTGDILFCTQHDKSQQLANISQSNLILKTIEHIRKQTSKRIILRPHPRCPLPAIEYEFENVVRQEPRQIINTYDDYDFDLTNVYLVYSFSSNPGLQSAIQGVPVCVSEHSLAYDVSNDWFGDINNLKYPDRQQWANDLAYTEWTIEEISTGNPLKRLTSSL